MCRAQSLALCDRAASEKWHTTARLFLRRRYVRFGSKADMCGAPTHVRFTPESGHSLAAPLRPNKDVIHVLASEYVKKYEQLLAQDIAVIPGCAAPELIVKRAPEFAPSISVRTLKTGAGSKYIDRSRG